MRKCIIYGLALIATLCYSSYNQNERGSTTENLKVEKDRNISVANATSKTLRAINCLSL